MKTGAGYFATAPSDCASAVFSGDSKANHAIAGDSGGSHGNAGSFASLEQEMAMGRKTSEQVRHACDDVMVLLICFLYESNASLEPSGWFPNGTYYSPMSEPTIVDRASP